MCVTVAVYRFRGRANTRTGRPNEFRDLVRSPRSGIVSGVDGEFLIFAGSASQRLGRAIAAYLGVELGKAEVIRFTEGNLFVRVLESVRGQDVFIVQSTAYPANDNFMELLFWIDALKRASAASVTVVMPYFSYAKGDKKDEPRVSIRARVCADAIEAAGADRVVSVDLHAPQIQGFFRVPVDDLQARPVLCEAISKNGWDDLVVVSPDAGFAKKARAWSNQLQAPRAIVDKVREGHGENAVAAELIGSVEGRTALIVDDFTITAGTLAEAARVVMEHGARRVFAAVTHGLLAEKGNRRLDESPIERLFITDTVETQPGPLSPRVEVVSVAWLLGEAIKRISHRQSISVLFE